MILWHEPEGFKFVLWKVGEGEDKIFRIHQRVRLRLISLSGVRITVSIPGAETCKHQSIHISGQYFDPRWTRNKGIHTLFLIPNIAEALKYKKDRYLQSYQTVTNSPAHNPDDPNIRRFDVEYTNHIRQFRWSTIANNFGCLAPVNYRGMRGFQPIIPATVSQPYLNQERVIRIIQPLQTIHG